MRAVVVSCGSKRKTPLVYDFLFCASASLKWCFPLKHTTIGSIVTCHTGFPLLEADEMISFWDIPMKRNYAFILVLLARSRSLKRPTPDAPVTRQLANVREVEC